MNSYSVSVLLLRVNKKKVGENWSVKTIEENDVVIVAFREIGGA